MPVYLLVLSEQSGQGESRPTSCKIIINEGCVKLKHGLTTDKFHLKWTNCLRRTTTAYCTFLKEFPFKEFTGSMCLTSALTQHG